ncbi:MAG: DNA-3-methyladenine glycosylase I [Candidatus Binataceae bacterium]|nr:DNA-3-methyladenine glycosylase I [Candidatus Binataceae bacterium]
MKPGNLQRCAWVGTALLIAYHDTEWGVPLHDDRKLFELLILEGAQAGLSWETVLKKREGYRAAFCSFDPATVARFSPDRVAGLLSDPGIVRNRLKIVSAVGNAKAFLQVQDQFSSFDAFIWRFVDGVPIRNARRAGEQIPATSPASDAIAKELTRRGFRFAGSTICYAFMQAAGMVNDHLIDCFRYAECTDQVEIGGPPRMTQH